jgi:hypothetical protein
LRWSADGGNSFREIVRQQWNFNPPETIREVEEYQVEIASVTALELIIVPNVSGGSARASLKSLAPVLRRDQGFLVLQERTARPRGSAPGSLLTSVREVARFLPKAFGTQCNE